jgi:hypothetical protein
MRESITFRAARVYRDDFSQICESPYNRSYTRLFSESSRIKRSISVKRTMPVSPRKSMAEPRDANSFRHAEVRLVAPPAAVKDGFADWASASNIDYTLPMRKAASTS